MKELCEATIEFGDDYGDNSSTFHCELEVGHIDEHKETGDMDEGENPYILVWRNDSRITKLNETIKYLESIVKCNHDKWDCPPLRRGLSDCDNHEWDICSMCGVFKRDSRDASDNLEKVTQKLLEMQARTKTE